MTLEDVNQKLQDLSVMLPLRVRELAQAEYLYERRFADIVVHSGMGTALLKEQEAKMTLDSEGLFQPLADLRGEVRALYHEKDCFIALSANLRTMSRDEVRE